MPRKLKIYQTSQGFYDLAVAAPSMKAALEAWGAGSNLFHQGFAKETDDREVVEAAMTKPGVVLQRPVGSNQPFREHSELPTIESLDLSASKGKAPRKEKPRKAAKGGEKDNSKATLAFERERHAIDGKRPQPYRSRLFFRARALLATRDGKCAAAKPTQNG
jgi:colicin import membrane protein